MSCLISPCWVSGYLSDSSHCNATQIFGKPESEMLRATHFFISLSSASVSLIDTSSGLCQSSSSPSCYPRDARSSTNSVASSLVEDKVMLVEDDKAMLLETEVCRSLFQPLLEVSEVLWCSKKLHLMFRC